MRTEWLYLMLKRLGRRAGVGNLHTHRFRHTWAMNMLRAGMHEQMMRHVAGWKKRVPDTYYRTLATEDVIKVHKQMSPADKLWGSGAEPKRRQGPGKGNPRGRL